MTFASFTAIISLSSGMYAPAVYPTYGVSSGLSAGLAYHQSDRFGSNWSFWLSIGTPFYPVLYPPVVIYEPYPVYYDPYAVVYDPIPVVHVVTVPAYYVVYDPWQVFVIPKHKVKKRKFFVYHSYYYEPYFYNPYWSFSSPHPVYVVNKFEKQKYVYHYPVYKNFWHSAPVHSANPLAWGPHPVTDFEDVVAFNNSNSPWVASNFERKNSMKTATPIAHQWLQRNSLNTASNLNVKQNNSKHNAESIHQKQSQKSINSSNDRAAKMMPNQKGNTNRTLQQQPPKRFEPKTNVGRINTTKIKESQIKQKRNVIESERNKSNEKNRIQQQGQNRITHPQDNRGKVAQSQARQNNNRTFAPQQQNQNRMAPPKDNRGKAVQPQARQNNNREIAQQQKNKNHVAPRQNKQSGPSMKQQPPSQGKANAAPTKW